MLHAIIDIGSNTIRLSIFDYDSSREVPIQIFNKKIMAGLAGYIDGEGALSDKGIMKAIESVASHQRKIANFKVDTVSAFATAVLRNAKNTTYAVRAIENATGQAIEVLSGEEEARLGFVGAMHNLETKQGVLMDIGGASTELVIFLERTPVFLTSIPHGSLNLFLAHVENVLPTTEEISCIRREIEAALDSLDGISGYSFNTIFGVGGAVRATGKISDALFHDGDKMLSVDLENIERMIDHCLAPGHKGLRDILSVVPDRVHTVLPGMLVAQAIALRFCAKRIDISRYGVREGYLFERMIGDGYHS